MNYKPAYNVYWPAERGSKNSKIQRVSDLVNKVQNYSKLYQYSLSLFFPDLHLYSFSDRIFEVIWAFFHGLMLEQVCCRNGQKPVTGLGNKDPLTVIQKAESRLVISFDTWLLETGQLCLLFINKDQFLL